jgi:prepilin-type N-terminal cleavage/methylation domain-containing protein
MHNNQAGLTLIELMIAMLLSTILGLTAFMVFQYTNKSSVNNIENSIIQQELITVMGMIEDDVKNTGADPLRTGTICNFYFYFPGEDNGPYLNNLCLKFDLSNPPNGNDTDAEERVDYYNTPGRELRRLVSVAGGDWPNPVEGYILATSMGLQVTYDTTCTVLQPCCTDGFTNDCLLNRICAVTVTLRKTGTRVDPDTRLPIEAIMRRTIAIRNYGTKRTEK